MRRGRRRGGGNVVKKEEMERWRGGGEVER
jgi:hypothetical protein